MATKTVEMEYPPQLESAVLLHRDRLRATPAQPREFFDPAALAELADSIREHGILQPLVVRYDPSRYDATPYVIVAGERRYRASEGILDTLPCIISDVSPAQSRLLALAENIQRQDLTAIEEARAVAELMTDQKLSAKAAARKLHVSLGWINNRLSLLKTGKDVQEVAARVPYAMSSLLLIDSIKSDPTERRELLEAVEDGRPHSEIKQRVERLQQERALLQSTRRAPDAQTQTRSGMNQRDGGGNMSRGRLLVGPTPKDGKQAIDAAITEIERHVRTVKAWEGKVSGPVFNKAVGRVRAAVEGLENK